MKSTVYIETSVIGYLTSWPSGDLIVAARQKITRDWWRDAGAKYELFLSEQVIAECSDGDPSAVEDRLLAIQGLPILTLTQEAEELGRHLIVKGAVPETEPEDALHIAIAVVNGLQYLSTWNFKHIANATMYLKIIDVCTDAGFTPTTILHPGTPSGGTEVTEESNHR